jgi:hypothetical protein
LRYIVAGGVVLALAGVIWALYRNSAPASLPQPSIADFRSELAAIALPAGATLEGPADENVRIGSLIVTNRFAFQQPATETRAFFHAALSSHGWEYKSGAEGSLWSDTYCKSSMAAKVALVQEDSSTSKVALTMSWNETTLLKCGDGAAPARAG